MKIILAKSYSYFFLLLHIIKSRFYNAHLKNWQYENVLWRINVFYGRLNGAYCIQFAESISCTSHYLVLIYVQQNPPRTVTWKSFPNTIRVSKRFNKILSEVATLYRKIRYAALEINFSFSLFPTENRVAHELNLDL